MAFDQDPQFEIVADHREDGITSTAQRNRQGRPVATGFVVKCKCGEASRPQPSAALAHAWHAGHREEVLAAASKGL